MKQIELAKDGTLSILTDENLDDVKRVLVTQKGSLYGGLFYPDSDYEDVVPKDFHDRCMQIEIAKRRELERPKGKWTNDGGPFLNRWICSECGYKQYLEPTKFCAGCGSEMTEEEEDNGTD